MTCLAFTLIIGAVIITEWTQAFPNEQANEDTRLTRLQRKGWWWGDDDKSEPLETGVPTEFGVYACILNIFDKKCNKRGLRLPYAPYGFQHTFVKIGSMCYDWGDWNYPRKLKCTDDRINCCYEDASRKSWGNSKCVNRLDEFESAWSDEGSSYNIFTWNCQRYTDAMKDFLESCYSDASDAIP